MPYSIEITKKALKDLAKVATTAEATIRERIEALAEDPRPYGYKQLKGSGLFRIRVGDYRVIYDIDDNVLIILILKVAHRSDAYD
jgi:mRNA interferase RelE/StbE